MSSDLIIINAICFKLGLVIKVD